MMPTKDKPVPLRLFTYRYWHPVAREFVTLDCPAQSVELALASAQRFLIRANRRLHRAKVPCRFQVPYHPSWMKAATDGVAA